MGFIDMVPQLEDIHQYLLQQLLITLEWVSLSKGECRDFIRVVQ